MQVGTGGGSRRSEVAPSEVQSNFSLLNRQYYCTRNITFHTVRPRRALTALGNVGYNADMSETDLFSSDPDSDLHVVRERPGQAYTAPTDAPLAARMRPKTLD